MKRSEIKRYEVIAGLVIQSFIANFEDTLFDFKEADYSDRRDVKVHADRIFHDYIKKELEINTFLAVVSEEDCDSLEFTHSNEVYWLIDPLDGTFNYSKGIPLCCISIALIEESIPICGLILDINRKEIFTTNIDNGTLLNGMTIKVSNTSSIDDSVLLTGFPRSTSFLKEDIIQFTRKIIEFKKVRLFGSAALSLAYVACGRADVYYEKDIKIWDVAAGLALVKSAGGVYIINKTLDDFTYEVLAFTMSLKSEIGSLLK